MKLVHWNIHRWTDSDGIDNVDRVIDLLSEIRPDVVSLVEVVEPFGVPGRLQRVAAALGCHWAFIPALELRDRRGFGNALLSRTPMRSVQQWQLLPPTPYDGSEPTEPRSVVLAQVDIDDRPLVVGSTHFPRFDADRRRHAADRLLELVSRLADGHVVLGDFNQPPAAWPDRRHLFAPDPPIPTYPTGSPNEAIDYCLAGGVDLVGFDVLDDTASDHLPILVHGEDDR